MNGQGPGVHVTYWLARDDGRLYLLHVGRSGAAVGNEDLEGEIGSIVASFRLLAVPKAPDKPAPPPQAAPAGEHEEMVFDFWRLRCVRPPELLRVPHEDEGRHGVILKLRGEHEQDSCTLRVCAFSTKQPGYRPVAKVAEWLVAHFEKAYPPEKRRPPEVGATWDVPLLKEARTLRLTAREEVTVTRLWYLADCRNERQYRVEVALRGAVAEEAWREPVGAFLASFTPLPRDGSRIEKP